MSEISFDLEKDLESIRKEFPILARCVYLISNSLGAVPRKAGQDLHRFYRMWAEEGVSAWEKEWWDKPRRVGNQVASLLGAGEDEVSMMPSATLCHWVALSTLFLHQNTRRNKVVVTDHDFPSILYAVSKIAGFMNWRVEVLSSGGRPGIDGEALLEKVDEETLFVATSHVYFKSGYVQDIGRIASRARETGALTLIDGYHAAGVIPVDVKALDVDFYVGGCLKWLCGGPGNAFLYVRPGLAEQLQPQLTGWFAHQEPFSFSKEMVYSRNSYRFMSGTPPIPSLYAAQAGLEFIGKIGIQQIREKSLSLTGLVIENARANGFSLFTPENQRERGGAVSISIPHAYSLKQALQKRGVKVDFRKGDSREPDVIRVGPHFYTTSEEITILFETINAIYESGEYRKFPEKIDRVT